MDYKKQSGAAEDLASRALCKEGEWTWGCQHDVDHYNKVFFSSLVLHMLLYCGTDWQSLCSY